MACIDDQQPSFKHYCRVCKKGFMCGRALGGHMRAHGIGDETGNLDDDDPVSDWEEKFGGGGSNNNNINNNNNSKKMYQLRTNPNRLKSCRTCENCGKEFLSWKSFLEHGKCSSDDASESLVSSPESEDDEDEEDDDDEGGGPTRRWSKRKRSLRRFNNPAPGEVDEDILLARCLVQLANTAVDPPTAEPEESCASAEERRNPSNFYLGPLPLKSCRPVVTFGGGDHRPATRGGPSSGSGSAPKGMFECKACKKVFNSHQALGGHRASHKKVKGCFAAKQDQTNMVQDDSNSSPAVEDDVINNNDEFLTPTKPNNYQFEQGHAATTLVGAARRKSKVHECSICHRVFTSGQALGGHKRCHWITANSPETTTSSLPKFHFQDNHNNNNNKHSAAAAADKLDLNVPAWAHVSGLVRDPLSVVDVVSTDMQLQPWVPPGGGDTELMRLKNGDHDNVTTEGAGKNETVDSENATTRYVEDEAESKVIKLAKLSNLNDLKEMDKTGSSSQWLQVGIGSTTKVFADV